MLPMKFAGLFASAALLAGCSQTGPASQAGTCDVFEAPTQYVTGGDDYSQGWVTETVEVGVGVCGWPRIRKPVEEAAEAEKPSRFGWLGL